MRKLLLLSAAILVTAGTLDAQQAGEASGGAKAGKGSGNAKAGKASLEALLGRRPDMKEPKTEAEREYARLLEQVRVGRLERLMKLREKLRKQREAGVAPKSVSLNLAMNSASPEVLAGFHAAAVKYRKTDDAIRFLVYLIGAETEPKKITAVIDRLLDEHMKSAGLTSLTERLPRVARRIPAEKLQATFARLIAESPHAEVKGGAHFARATVATGRRRKGPLPEAARDDLKKALALAPKATFAPRARGILFEAERLGIGCVAPDIVGKDTDGIPFKLSDYKGKVILLDFWGHW